MLRYYLRNDGNPQLKYCTFQNYRSTGLYTYLRSEGSKISNISRGRQLLEQQSSLHALEEISDGAESMLFGFSVRGLWWGFAWYTIYMFDMVYIKHVVDNVKATGTVFSLTYTLEQKGGDHLSR